MNTHGQNTCLKCSTGGPFDCLALCTSCLILETSEGEVESDKGMSSEKEYRLLQEFIASKGLTAELTEYAMSKLV